MKKNMELKAKFSVVLSCVIEANQKMKARVQKK